MNTTKGSREQEQAPTAIATTVLFALSFGRWGSSGSSWQGSHWSRDVEALAQIFLMKDCGKYHAWLRGAPARNPPSL